MQKSIKGPSRMPKKFKGSNGWSYHPTKGFRRDHGYGARNAYNQRTYVLSHLANLFSGTATPSQW